MGVYFGSFSWLAQIQPAISFEWSRREVSINVAEHIGLSWKIIVIKSRVIKEGSCHKRQKPQAPTP